MAIAINRVVNPTRYIVEIWDDPTDSSWEFAEPFHDDFYTEINNWCYQTFKCYCRTAYNRFEFKTEKDLTMFMLRWGHDSGS